MDNNSFLPPKGFRDFKPEEALLRKKVISVLEKVFLQYGFEPIETPTLEYASTLMGKYGEEADKLLYLFTDQGDRQVGLNYDLTVPTARFLSRFQDIPKPFKRYQIQPSYRAENPQKGRYRQFVQCDIDIIGNTSPMADAEIVAVIDTALTLLKVPGFKIKINSRTLLNQLAENVGIAQSDRATFFQTIDKADKLEPVDLDKELDKKGLGTSLYTKQVLPLLEKIKADFDQTKLLPDKYLEETFTHIRSLGVPEDHIEFSPHIVRGLDYYTGPIFETVVTEPKIGSVTGGGRYDHLIKSLGGPDLPAVGTTLGLDRLCDVLIHMGQTQTDQNTSVLVTVLDQSLLSKYQNLVQTIRNAGINAQVYLNPNDKLDKQLKFADKKNIPYVLIMGSNEISTNSVTIKNLNTKEQKIINIADLIPTLLHETNPKI